MSEKSYNIFSWLIVLPALLLRAWALRTLWAWFMVPDFQALTFINSLGLSLIAALLRRHDVKIHKTDEERFENCAKIIAQDIVFPFLLLAAAWLIKAVLT